MQARVTHRNVGALKSARVLKCGFLTVVLKSGSLPPPHHQEKRLKKHSWEAALQELKCGSFPPPFPKKWSLKKFPLFWYSANVLYQDFNYYVILMSWTTKVKVYWCLQDTYVIYKPYFQKSTILQSQLQSIAIMQQIAIIIIMLYRRDIVTSHTWRRVFADANNLWLTV